MAEFVVDELAAVVVAGGRSRWMGQAKADLRLGDKRLVEHVVDELRGCAPILLALCEPDQIRAPNAAQVVVDGPRYAGHGPLAGVLAGLEAARERDCKNAFVTSVDAPYLRAEQVEALRSRWGSRRAGTSMLVVADPDGMPQPLFCVVDVALASQVARERLEAGVRRLFSWMDGLARQVVPAGELDPCLAEPGRLAPVNTPQDWERSRRIFASEADGER